MYRRLLPQDPVLVLAQSTVAIVAEGRVGTAFYILPNLLLTCAHVIEGLGSKIRLITHDDTEFYGDAVGGLKIAMLDLAVLATDRVGVPLSLGADARSGCHFASFGYARYELGYRGVPIRGTVLGPTRRGKREALRDLISLGECSIEPGMSGAPVLEITRGMVVGVIKRHRDDGGYAIPCSLLASQVPGVQIATRAHGTSKDAGSLSRYLDAVRRENEYIRMVDLSRDVRLDDVFITLALTRTGADRRAFDASGRPIAPTKPSSDNNVVWTDRGDVDLLRDRARPTVTITAAFAHARIVILGDPGSGKTTLFRHVARKATISTDTFGTPVMIRLADLAASGVGLAEYVGHRFAPYREPLRRALFAGDACILFDGLDEVQVDRLPSIRDEIEAAAAWGNRVAVSCRTVAYPSGFFSSDYKLLDVLGLTTEQQRSFLVRWFTSNPEKADAVTLALASTSGMLGLSSNPLLLSLLAIVTENDPSFSIPTRRAHLYSRAVELLLRSWPCSKGLLSNTEVRPDIAQILLEELAFGAFAAGSEVFSRADIRVFSSSSGTEICSQLGFPLDSNAVFKWLSSANGLLVLYAKDRYRFLHLTFQEYLCACAIARNPDRLLHIREHAGEARWEEVIRLLAGIAKDSEKIISIVWQEGADEDIFRSRLFLAGRCLADAEGVRPDFAMPIAGQLVALLAHKSALIRNQAAKALVAAATRFPETVDGLAARLTSSGPRDSALRRTCGMVSAPSMVHAWSSLVEACPLQPEVLLDCVEALAAIADTRAAEVLLGLVSCDEPTIAANAGAALRRRGEGPLLKDLVALLRDPREHVRVAAACALVGSQNPEVLSRVVAGLEDEHTSSVGRAVFEEVLRCSRDFPELDGAVRRLLAADDERVRVSGIRITAALGLSAAAEILGEVIASEDEAVVSRTAAAETLVEFGPAAVGDAVIAVFVSSSTTADLKRNLASLLRGAPVPSVVDALHRTLKDPSNPRSVRRSCIESLAAIGSKTSTSVLESVLLTARNEIEIAPAAVRALASCGASAVIERLASESNWNEPVASRRALYDALGSVGTAAAEATLLARVGKERDARALGSCIRALKRFRSPHSEAVLLTTLTTDWLPPGLRSEAADALATSDRSDILVELLKHLQAADPDPYVWDAIFFSAHGLWRRLGTRAPTGTMDAIAALIRQPAPEPPEVEDLVQLLRATVRGDRDAESRLRSACRFLMGDSKQSAHMRRLGSILLQVAAGERQPPLETLPADISVRLAQALQTLEER